MINLSSHIRQPDEIDGEKKTIPIVRIIFVQWDIKNVYEKKHEPIEWTIRGYFPFLFILHYGQ